MKCYKKLLTLMMLLLSLLKEVIKGSDCQDEAISMMTKSDLNENGGLL